MENMEEDRVDEILSSFSCAKDPDIESFIQHWAVEFEKLYKARTYLVLDQDQLESETPDKLIIYGYISLALKVLSVPDELSNRKRMSLDGFSSKIMASLSRCFLAT